MSISEGIHAARMGFLRDFAMVIKNNRNVALSAAGKTAGRSHMINTLDWPEGMPQEIYLKSVDFPLLLLKQVFTHEDGSLGIL